MGGVREGAEGRTAEFLGIRGEWMVTGDLSLHTATRLESNLVLHRIP